MFDMKAVPLAFALAVAAAAPDPAAAAPADLSELLKSGSLRHLAQPDQTPIDKAGVSDDQGARQQTAQACWSGYWRRC